MCEPPKSKADIKAFIHLCGFYHSHIQGFAEIASPLTEMLKKDVPFEMNKCQEQAWELLKEQTLKATELAFYKPNLINKVYTDASDIGIGGVFTQVNDNDEERPVRFLSRKLTETERRYDTVSKELLAISYVLQKLRKYLLGQKFTLYTDSSVVRWLFTKKDISAKHERYIMLLQDFPCTVVHVPGKRNVVADILSRYPVEEPKGDLDTFSHIVMIEENELNYEELLIYVYMYIINLSFNGIPEEFQRRTHLERKNFVITDHKLYKKSSYGLLQVPKLTERTAVMTQLHDGHGHFGQEVTYQRTQREFY